MAQDVAVAEAAMTIDRERRVIGDIVVEVEPANRRSIRGRGRLGSLSKPRIGILRGRPVGALFAFRAGLGCYGAGGHVLYSYGSIAPTFTCLHFCNLTFQSFKGVSS
jgi:hypothetical protein